MRFSTSGAIFLMVFFASVSSDAQDVKPTPEGAQGHFQKQDHYSPYAGRSFPTQVFWGDTHLHTGMSMDAGAFGARLSPEDAYRFARGEEVTSSTGQQAKLQLGMQLEQRFGTNPYKFGMIGSTDSHTGLATAQEDNFFGKHSGAEPSAQRWEHPMAKVGDAEYTGWGMVASGYAAVWAKENTRDALFDAMKRKETYATTGSRMTRALLRRLGFRRTRRDLARSGGRRLRQGRADGWRPAWSTLQGARRAFSWLR